MKIDPHKLATFIPVLLSLGLFFTGMEFSLSILLISILLLSLIITDRNPAVKKILIISFLIRVIVAFVDHYGYLTHYGWDDFFTIALQIKTNMVKGYPLLANVYESIHAVAYGVFCAFFYYLLGDYQIIVRIVNCFLGILVADRVFRISLRLTNDEKSSVLAAGITAFYPSFVIYCALDMRDALIFFLTAEMLYRISLIINKKTIMDLTLLIFEMIVLYFLRTQYLILFSIIGLLYFFIHSNLYKNRLKRFILSLIIVAIVVIGYRNLQELGYFPILLRSMNADMAWRAAGGSAYLVGVQYETWWDIFRWTPIRMIHFAFGPFFWSVNNPFMLMSAIESFLLIFLAIAAFTKKARQQYYKNPNLYLILFLFTMIGLLSSAVIDSNYGTAIRHKMNFIFIFFIFSAQYIKNIKIVIV